MPDKEIPGNTTFLRVLQLSIYTDHKMRENSYVAKPPWIYHHYDIPTANVKIICMHDQRLKLIKEWWS